MRCVWMVAAWFAGGYLAGSVPFGWLIGRMRGVDIRKHGSRNIGATNCGRLCGAPWGVLAFVLDVAKGFLPVFALVSIEQHMEQGPLPRLTWFAIMIVAVGPILGHVFPVWLRFRGGKAVSTSLGVLAALPMLQWMALAAFGVWVVLVLVTRYVSVASSVAAVVFVCGYLVFESAKAWGNYLPVTVFVILLVAMVLVRHRSNYARLLRGEENRLWDTKGEKAGGDADRPALDQDATVPPPRQPEPQSEKGASRP
ncbi:MAG TPA: glycerol-3-phosphate 1-O-acyltransferase PlsY [Phycisphaerae bacterium]|nr:glycerol-3-phosphate 1-O-acyltransferase PlsY [Phycisphaerae bacterium]